MNYYQRYLRKIQRGVRFDPRNMPTHASFNESFEFVPGTCWRRPHDNPAIGFCEGLQFIAGLSSVNAIAAAAPNVNLSLFGPVSFYGPRTVGQFERAIAELSADVRSRRAVVMIAHPNDMPDTVPCTLSMNFWIDPETGQLNNTVAVRSSDAVWGLPYDMIQYGMVTLAVGACIGAIRGKVTVNIANAHIYEDHDGGTQWDEGAFSIPKFHTWTKYVEWASSIVEFCPTRRELEDLFFVHTVLTEEDV